MAELSETRQHILTPEYWDGNDLTDPAAFMQSGSLVPDRATTLSHFTRSDTASLLSAFINLGVRLGPNRVTETLIDSPEYTPEIPEDVLETPKIVVIEEEAIFRDFPSDPENQKKYGGQGSVASQRQSGVFDYWHQVMTDPDPVKQLGDHIVFHDEFAHYSRTLYWGVPRPIKPIDGSETATQMFLLSLPRIKGDSVSVSRPGRFSSALVSPIPIGKVTEKSLKSDHKGGSHLWMSRILSVRELEIVDFEEDITHKATPKKARVERAGRQVGRLGLAF